MEQPWNDLSFSELYSTVCRMDHWLKWPTGIHLTGGLGYHYKIYVRENGPSKQTRITVLLHERTLEGRKKISLVHRYSGPTSMMLGVIMRLYYHLSSCGLATDITFTGSLRSG